MFNSRDYTLEIWGANLNRRNDFRIPYSYFCLLYSVDYYTVLVKVEREQSPLPILLLKILFSFCLTGVTEAVIKLHLPRLYWGISKHWVTF